MSIAQIHDRIAAIDQAAWDRCAGGGNPFVSHAFLAALEASGSVGPGTGWQPQHITLTQDGRLVAAAPMYAKAHSYGEYVFDHGWANAYEQADGRYYPKLLIGVPFSPVPGPRLLRAPDAPADAAPALGRAAVAHARRHGLSSVHMNFAREDEARALEAEGWLLRLGTQFHWENDGYAGFDDFLAALASRKRKAIRKERREVADAGVELRVLTGADLKPEHWEAFFAFYQDTSDRKWGSPYLTRGFFDRLGATLADRVALVLATHEGRYVAGALNLIGDDTLYGRNWGCVADFRFLHFEACYYQAIDFAIARGLKRVEAGAQGEHKIQRGYLPQPTFSAHWIAHAGLRQAIAQFLERERAAMQAQMAELATLSPFRQEDGCGVPD